MGKFLLKKILQTIVFIIICIMLFGCVSQQNIFNQEEFEEKFQVLQQWSNTYTNPFGYIGNIKIINEEIVLVEYVAKYPFPFVINWKTYDLDNGQVLWELPGGFISDYYGQVVFDEEFLYSGNTAKLRAFDLESGRIIWKSNINAIQWLTIVDDQLIVGDKYRIFSLNKSNGNFNWEYKTEKNPFLILPSENKKLIYSLVGSNILVLNATTGIKEEKFSNPCKYSQIDSIFLWDDKLYCDSSIMDLEDGKLISEQGNEDRIVFRNNNIVYYLGKDFRFYAYDLINKQVKWEKYFFSESGEPIDIVKSFFTDGNHGLFYTFDGVLRVIDLDTGNEKYYYSQNTKINYKDYIYRYFINNSQVIQDDLFVFSVDDQSIYVFSK